MKKEVEFDIGFADSAVSGYVVDNGNLTVRLIAWNGVKLSVSFHDFEGMADYSAGDISSLVEFDGKNDFLSRVLQNVFEVPPAQTGLRLFQFLNLDEEPSLEVVSPGIKIFRQG